MGALEDSSYEERQARGWSRWDILVKGLNNSLLQDLGRVLVNDFSASPEVRLHGLALLQLGDALEPDFKVGAPRFPEKIKAHYKALTAQAEATFTWLSENYEETSRLKTEGGRPLLRIIGEALTFFGEYELHGWPGRGIYEGEAGYDLWREACVKHGKALASEDPVAAPGALLWLKDWHGSVWD